LGRLKSTAAAVRATRGSGWGRPARGVWARRPWHPAPARYT